MFWSKKEINQPVSVPFSKLEIIVISLSGLLRVIARLLAARVNTSPDLLRQEPPRNASPTTWCPWRSQKPQQRTDPNKAAGAPSSSSGGLPKIKASAARAWKWLRTGTGTCRADGCRPPCCPTATQNPCGPIGAPSLDRRSTPETKLRSGTGCRRSTLPSPAWWKLSSWIVGGRAPEASQETWHQYLHECLPLFPCTLTNLYGCFNTEYCQIKNKSYIYYICVLNMCTIIL